jgi:hypothetical protein
VPGSPVPPDRARADALSGTAHPSAQGAPASAQIPAAPAAVGEEAKPETRANSNNVGIDRGLEAKIQELESDPLLGLADQHLHESDPLMGLANQILQAHGLLGKPETPALAPGADTRPGSPSCRVKTRRARGTFHRSRRGS